MNFLMERKHEFITEYLLDEEENVTELAAIMRHTTINENEIIHTKTDSPIAYYRPCPKGKLSLSERKELRKRSSLRKISCISLEEVKQIQKNYQRDPFSIFTFSPSES